MTKYSELFLKYDYPETKELCLKFLTIVISILVFSVTFSEKIVDFENSIPVSKILMIGSWILLILAIVFCGLGLTVHTKARGQAVYGNNDDIVRKLAQKAYKLIIIAGAAFILGLFLLTGTATFAIIKLNIISG